MGKITFSQLDEHLNQLGSASTKDFQAETNKNCWSKWAQSYVL